LKVPSNQLLPFNKGGPELSVDLRGTSPKTRAVFLSGRRPRETGKMITRKRGGKPIRLAGGTAGTKGEL